MLLWKNETRTVINLLQEGKPSITTVKRAINLLLRLDSQIDRLYKEINVIQQEQYTNGRNDGVREFAEKLKAKSDYCYLGNIDSLAYRILGKDLDSLVKEMTGG